MAHTWKLLISAHVSNLSQLIIRAASKEFKYNNLYQQHDKGPTAKPILQKFTR